MKKTKETEPISLPPEGQLWTVRHLAFYWNTSHDTITRMVKRKKISVACWVGNQPRFTKASIQTNMWQSIQDRNPFAKKKVANAC